MYKFDNRQLRVCYEVLRSLDFYNSFKNTRFILLQHVLTDTEEFVQIMVDAGMDIHSLVAKPYSIDLQVKERLLLHEFLFIHENYDVLENTLLLDELITDALNKSVLDEKNILIVDVGGYFLAPLLRLSHPISSKILGIVEVTKFGHNRYKDDISNLNYPVISIAESQIKTLEGRFVGMSAVTAVDKILRDFGLSISGRHALVIGFGLIGKNVAAALKARNLPVKVYDTNGFPRAEAFTLGYLVGEKNELLSRSDLILSATANRAITYEDILNCKDGCIIGSVGSKQNEIDVERLNSESISVKKIHDFITEFSLPNGKTIYLLKEGEAVNFIVQSCPDEIIDLIFAETIYCCKHLIEDFEKYTHGEIHKTPMETTHEICKKWLNLVGVNS